MFLYIVGKLSLWRLSAALWKYIFIKETVYKLHIKYSAFTIHLPLKVQNLSKILSFEHAADLEIIALLQNKNLLMEVNACKNSNFRMVSYVL